VVTNALRLRGFHRPDGAEAILHPPVAQRVREYGYLLGIAAVAAAIGIAALVFAQRGRTGKHMSGTPHAVSADRTITLDATDQLRFSSRTLTVHAGETVAFTVTYTGKTGHEFMIGDAAAQQGNITVEPS
jgi:uncharacterized cupredoxin-like copper-binding protein